MAVATDTDSTATDTATEEAAAAAATAGNNPGLLGLPTFAAGAIPLGLFLVGYKDGATGGLLVNIILVAGLGLLISTIWAIKVGSGAVAAIFGIFACFWLSFALLVLGNTHGWFVPAGLEPEAVAAAAAGGTAVYLIAWTIAVLALVLATLRLPLAFTVLFFLVDLTFFLVLLANLTSESAWATIAGYVVFAFTVVGVYLFMDAMGQATGGKAMPLGRPIMH